MKKRTLLSLIIGTLCFMNLFVPILNDETYFELFRMAASDEQLSSFWKVVFMGPTGILAVLTLLHIAEPKSERITRNHLAVSGIIGFLLYIVIYGLMHVAATLFLGTGDLIYNFINSTDYQSADPGLLYFGWSPVLYPLLFLAYVLVHRFMRYDSPEAAPASIMIKRKNERPQAYDEDEFV